MCRIEILRRFLTDMTIALAALAMTGCDGGHASVPDSTPTRDRSEVAARDTLRARRDERARGIAREGHECVTENKGEDLRLTECRGDDGAVAEGEDAHALVAQVRDLYAAQLPMATDLEFSEGLPEPPQQQVATPPAPWAPSPDAEAGAKPVIEDVWPARAPSTGGGRVVLRGKNFQVAQVVFGLAPAQIISQTQDSVTVAVPPATGQVAIVVTNRDGNYSIAAQPFRYDD
jgi:IPT/TIG domain